MLSQRQKKLLRWVGYPLLALVTFVFVLHLTFPYSRVVDRFVVEPLRGKYQVSYLGVDRGILPGNITIRGLALSSLDADEDDADSTNLYFKEVSLDLGLLDLVRGRADVEFSAKLGSGTIDGHVEASRAELDISVDASSVPLESIGGVRTAVGLPMEGSLNLSVALTMPGYRWDKMNGAITLGCPGCTIGDGVTKIKPRAPPGRRMSRNTMLFAGDGITVPQLALGNLGATMTIEDGRGSIDDFKAESDDGDMALQAVVRFTKSIGQSRFESGCMKFRLSDSLKEREKDFGNLPTFMKISPEPDGFSNVKLQGLVKAMRWIPTKQCGAGDEEDGDDERVARPRVTRPRDTAEPETDQPKTLTPGLTPGLNRVETGDKVEDEGVKSDTDEGVTVPEPRTSGPPLARPPSIADDVGITKGLQRVEGLDEGGADEDHGDQGHADDNGSGDHDEKGGDADEGDRPNDGARDGDNRDDDQEPDDQEPTGGGARFE